LGSLRATIAALTYDLIEAAADREAHGFCFLPERSTDFTRTLAAQRQYQSVRKTWAQLGLIEWMPGVRHGLEFDGVYVAGTGKAHGKAPRLRALGPLLTIAASYGISPENIGHHFERHHALSFPVILSRDTARDGKERIQPVGSEEANRIAEEVRAINAFLEQQDYDPYTVPRLVCQFTEDPERPGELAWDGRLYSRVYQSWKKDQRRALRINGEVVAEIDIKASHLTIYLAKQGVYPPKGGDPYDVPGLPRLVVKRLVTALFGNRGQDPQKWPMGLKEDYRQETGGSLGRDFKLHPTIDRIRAVIPSLADLPMNRLHWGPLQKIEATIMRGTVLKLSQTGIPALPIHDGLLVPIGSVDTAALTLESCFQEMTGTTPTLEIMIPATME
jgi:hypothetical protein